VLAGLARSPKAISSRWLWDERGSQLFEAITELPEYYPTRREREILEAHAHEIAEVADADWLVELGSGSSAKTTTLLDAFLVAGTLHGYAAVDLSETALRPALAKLADPYPELSLRGYVADLERQLASVDAPGRRLVAFLGGTFGALEPDERAAFLRQARSFLADGGQLLLGVDLVKPVDRIVAAYNDREGLSAQLIANLLPVLNRELDAGFDTATFRSEARWNPQLERMEMAVRSLVDQVVPIVRLGLEVVFGRGETLRTEISTRFRREGLEAELAAADLELLEWWTDAAGDFALCIARPDGLPQSSCPSSEG
jgi:L-histidine N-alpha-methyltransferase